MKQVLRKFVHKQIQGTAEVVINERIEKELLTQDELEELQTRFIDDDAESAYTTYGIYGDWDGDIVGIKLDTLTEGLKDYLKDEDEEDYSTLRDILRKIEPFRTYDLDFESEPVKA